MGTINQLQSTLYIPLLIVISYLVFRSIYFSQLDVTFRDKISSNVSIMYVMREIQF